MRWEFDGETSRSPGMAAFSRDRHLRYRLGRKLSTAQHVLDANWYELPSTLRRVVFVMLNPSTADAFKPDRTIARCCVFATRWGAEVLEVVNLFAFRSPHPSELKLAADRGDGADNDAVILERCRGATYVICAWGSGGALAGRGNHVASTLISHQIPLRCLARVPSDGSPMHPLARGKHRIPDTQDPVPWTA